MRFQTKMMLTYLTVSIILVGLVGISFYYYNAANFEYNTRLSQQSSAEKMIQQTDNLIRSMDYTMESLIANDDFMEAMAVRAFYNRESTGSGSIMNTALQKLRAIMYRDPLNRYFYRANVFNLHGDFFTSSYDRTDDLKVLEIIEELPWIDEVNDARKYPRNRIIVPTYQDPWDQSDEKQYVFSVARAVPSAGGTSGYIEIQASIDQLKEVFDTGGQEGLSVLAIVNDDQILYYDDNGIRAEDLPYYISQFDSDHQEIQNPRSGKSEMLMIAESDYSLVKVMIILDKDAMLSSLTRSLQTILLISGIAMIAAIFLTYIWSIRLTAPLRKLRSSMELTDWNQLMDGKQPDTDSLPAVLPSSDKDEIKALDNTFHELQNRLKVSVENQMRAQALQLEANFDSLQSQINPHFLYNILNVLSNKGMEVDDMEICEICDGIASILRYSTSTKNSIATLGDEIKYVENYLGLQKKRFEDDLSYEVALSPGMKEISIPKLVLQPLIENSLDHAYEHIARLDMFLGIKGSINEKGDWTLLVIDNGEGFSAESLAHLRQEIEDTRQKLIAGKEPLRFSLGGMGIVNTFARLWLYWEGNFCFEIGNNPDSGAYVRIAYPAKPNCL